MRIYYVSPSVLPSRSANSIHVMRMCEALAATGNEVTLFFQRTIRHRASLKAGLQDFYGADLAQVELVSFHSRWGRATNLRIAIHASWRYLASVLWRREPEVLISRNLYASFFFGVLLRRCIVFETHQLERGVKRRLQGALLTRPWVTTVVISKALLGLLAKECGSPPARPVVLPDAAPAGLRPLSRDEKEVARAELGLTADLAEYRAIAGYFGHLYPGRGIEIIRAVAERTPDVAFLVFGGNPDDIERLRQQRDCPNLRVMGHVRPAVASRKMALMDILLMPYQRNVSIGVRHHDTARWMSPMKMFEYMAVGVPILASRLPALEEVLEDRRNCILVTPDDPGEWAAGVQTLLGDESLAVGLAAAAHRDYLEDYNWMTRARRMLEAVQ